MNHLKCELCPRQVMVNDILCFICASRFQSIIPSPERTAMDAKIGEPLFLTLPPRIPDALDTENAYYRKWRESVKDVLR